MIKNRDIKDILRVLETFEAEKPREYISKQRFEQLFKGRFGEANLKRIIRNLQDKKYTECIEYADFTDYRIRISTQGRSFLEGKIDAKAKRAPFRSILLWIAIGALIYGLVHYIFIKLIH
jgi:protoporphyrinogen oxidase